MAESRSHHWIASVEELQDNSRVIADIEGREIAVFTQDGDYYAVANHCIHQSGPLCEGRLQGAEEFQMDGDDWEWRHNDDSRVIVCPWHAWRFDITTGENIDDSRYKVPTYEVEISNGDVYVVA